jgi:hypothetical protein
MLDKWTTLGTRLNAVAHIMNARNDLPPQQLLPVLTQLRLLVKTSFSTLLAADTVPAAYTLAPPVRHHLRKVGVNLAQIRARLDHLGFEVSPVLIRLLNRIRTLMNGDQPPHGA